MKPVIVLLVVTLVLVCAVLLIRTISRPAKKGISRHMIKHPEWYDAVDFPEEHFPPREEYHHLYQRRVIAGREKAKHRTVVITGLARDIEKNIKKNIERLVKIGEEFRDYMIVIFENDSVDNTRNILETANATNHRIVLVPCPESPGCVLHLNRAVDDGILNKGRFHKMATFRNRSLDYIRQEYPGYDYLLVVDLDLSGPISREGLLSCLSYKEWDAMSAVGLVNHPFTSRENLSYYDSLAFVPFGQKYRNGGYLKTLVHTIKTFSMSIPHRDEPAIRVASGFAGCCLYRLAPLVLLPVYYSGDKCEHVAFHESMTENGLDRIYVNPAFTLLHTLTVSRSSKRWIERIMFS